MRFAFVLLLVGRPHLVASDLALAPLHQFAWPLLPGSPLDSDINIQHPRLHAVRAAPAACSRSALQIACHHARGANAANASARQTKGRCFRPSTPCWFTTTEARGSRFARLLAMPVRF